MRANIDFCCALLISTKHFFNPFHHRGFAFHHIAFKSFFFVRRWQSDCIVKVTLRKNNQCIGADS